ncbi:hypothetical protein C8034_v004655 [Colletotrichum sidae]|uniref:Uncharacterized protein n=1 Tax=Colletotrichum sidae TaxID=1347389 RepID=A0A4V3I298_9PEZI|nr:hypothetical protein C8034_v004655 [Colletotrichum sidae]
MSLLPHFKLDLPGGKIVSSLHNIPVLIEGGRRPDYLPLIVALHGGCYTSAYFDVASYSARHLSDALSVVFVAISRPGYDGTSPVDDMPSEISFQEAWGTFLHDTLLPALWKEFGLPNDCSSIPIHCHSLGTPGACVAAALHADEASSAYPLAGITISGFGNGVSNFRVSMDPFLPPGEPASIPFPNDMKDALMLVPGTHEPSMLKHTARLNRPVPYREMADLSSNGLATWQDPGACSHVWGLPFEDLPSLVLNS